MKQRVRESKPRGWLLPIVLLIVAALGSGCVHSVHEHHVGDYSPAGLSGGRPIESYAEQFVVLGAVDNTDYVNHARSSLMAKCKEGEVRQVRTQISTSLGFFSWTNKARMWGMCYGGTAR